jgi:hypothetical protein
VGYDVVTVYPSNARCAPPSNLGCGISVPSMADPWVAYGVDAGWLFW